MHKTLLIILMPEDKCQLSFYSKCCPVLFYMGVTDRVP